MFWEFWLIKYSLSTKYIRLATVFGLILFFGLRGFVYTDWMSYYPLFKNIPIFWGNEVGKIANHTINEQFKTDIVNGTVGIELGFIYSTALFKTIIPNYFAWIFINTFFDIILLDIFFKRYSKYYVLSFILFLVFGGLILEFNLLRNIKAILLFLLSLKYLQNRQIIPYMLINGLGLLFHSTAIIFFPLYFILYKEWPKKLLWIIFFIGNIVFLFHMSYLKPILIFFGDLIGGRLMLITRVYFENDLFNKPYGIGLGYIERIITFGIIMYFYKRLKEDSINNLIFINAYIIYFIIYFYFAELSIAVERLSLLFAFSYWILYPNIIKLISGHWNKLFVVTTFMFYCILKLTASNSNIFSKYDNIISGIESFEIRKQRVEKDLQTVINKK